MENVFDTLQARGFIQQVTHPEDIKTRLQQGPVTFYIGFDPTASSFHIGNLLPIMAMVHMQRAGHRPIAILGAGTAMVGDPSGKTEMRQMLTRETIDANALALRAQLERYLAFDGDNSAMLLNNGDWLFDLRYIDFLRDVGRYFSVNRMLTFEAYKQRMETGLSFLEFNYQLLQAYDFLVLRQRHDCILQMGGDDQWGNMVAGADLIRRVEQSDAFAITFPLLATASGQKMGKTADGAVWLDAERTPPYEFYQFWINVDDRDVKRFLRFYTLLSQEELARFDAMEGAELRQAKQALAFEATKITHGETAAREAEQAAQAVFGGDGDAASMPQTVVAQQRFDGGVPAVDLFVETGLAASKGAARRLIQQGGASLNGARVDTIDATVTLTDVQDGAVILRAGKKRYHRVVVD